MWQWKIYYTADQIWYKNQLHEIYYTVKSQLYTNCVVHLCSEIIEIELIK